MNARRRGRQHDVLSGARAPQRRIASRRIAGVVVTAFGLAQAAACGSDRARSGEGSGGAAQVSPLGGAGGGFAGNGGGTAGAPFEQMGTGGGVCNALGQPCSDSTECCGGGYCNTVGPAPEWVGCQEPCNADADCASGCCLVYTNASHGFCTDAKWCACGGTAARCGTTLPQCCDGYSCVGGDAQGTFFECRKKCAQASDCDTGCCVLVPSIHTNACLDPTYCGK